MRIKHILLSWLKLLKSILVGWFLYLPVYLFWSILLWAGLHLTQLYPAGFWQVFGVIVLLRLLKNVWNLKGDAHVRADLYLHKQPYQLPSGNLPWGLCWYGERLLIKTQDAFYDVQSGERLREDDEYRQYAPATTEKP